MNFIEQLKQIPDHRKSKGKRHPLWLVMCLTLLGVLCGYHGYRPLADFCEKPWETLQTMLELPTERRILLFPLSMNLSKKPTLAKFM